jgi:hypothetical protein
LDHDQSGLRTRARDLPAAHEIEQTFKDCKDLLHLTKLVNKQQRYLEQVIALVLIAYVIGLWCGDVIRDVVYGKLPVEKLKENLFGNSQVDVGKYPKWLNYSGLFVNIRKCSLTNIL